MSVGGRLNQCFSAEEAEGAAAVLGLSAFARRYNGRLILETDCKSMGCQIQDEGAIRSACYAVLADARRILSTFASWEVRIIGRNKNSLAHVLAASARRNGDFSLLANIPNDAIFVMQKEVVTTMA